MTEPNRIDPERLAALIDGKLGESEADALRRELALADEDTLAAFADAAAVTAELAAEAEAAAAAAAAPSAPLSASAPAPATSAASQAVLPIRPRGGRRWVAATWTAMAAAAAVTAIIVFRSSKPPYQPSLFVAAIQPGAAAPDPAWSVTRGAGDALSDRARAVRVGALLTDIGLDVREGAPLMGHARLLANALDGALGATSVVVQWRSLAADTTRRLSNEQAADLGGSSLSVVDRGLADAGGYLEAVRIASAAFDTTFLKRVSDKPLADLEGNVALDSALQQAIRSFRTSVQGQRMDPQELGRSATELLRALAE